MKLSKMTQYDIIKSQFDKYVKKYEDIALSNHDILQLLDGKANIVLYPNLHKYDNIDQLLEPYGAFVLLFEAKPKYGHWTCIFKLDNDTLEFFNPYGGFPDNSLRHIPDGFKRQSYQNHTYLSALLFKSPYELTYNEHKFQKLKKNIRTCGRHCVFRLLCRWMSLKQYYDFLVDISKQLNMNFDQLVTFFTMT
jgi:hypothetical protein